MNRNFSFPYVEILRIYLCAFLRSEIYNTSRKQFRREVVSYRFTDLLSYRRMDLRVSEYKPIYIQRFRVKLFAATENKNGQHTCYCRQEQFQYATGATPNCAKQTPQAATKPKTEAASIGLATFAPNSKHAIWK